MSKEKTPMNIIIPIIVVTWILSLISSLAILIMMPSLIPGREQISDNSVTSSKIADGTINATDLAAGAVTASILASNAIPYNMTYVDGSDTNKATITQVAPAVGDIRNMTLEITLERDSMLLIIFSAVAKVNTAEANLGVQALVDDVPANPGPITFVSGETSLMPRTFNFYLADLGSGKHQIKLQGTVLGGVSPMGEIRARTLIVIVLPK